MEASASLVAGGLRVALQVLTSFKRPVIEVYETLRTVSQPPTEILHPGGGSSVHVPISHRFEDTFFDITMINIGGIRAENVRIRPVGEVPRFPGGIPKIVFDGLVARFPPGQSLLLLKIQSYFVNTQSAGFSLVITYDGPSEGLNQIGRFWSQIRKRPQYSITYTFDPGLYEGTHLPTPEYNG